MATIYAKPSHIFVKDNQVSGPQGGATSIIYDSEMPGSKINVAFKNHNPKSGQNLQWKILSRTDLISLTNQLDGDEHGSFKRLVTRGDMWEFRLLRDFGNPDNPEAVLARTIVLGLVESDQDPGLDKDPRFAIGGTYYTRTLASGQPTFAYMWVTSAQPNKVELLEWPWENLKNFQPTFVDARQLDYVGLLPGNSYFATIFVMDQTGRFFWYSQKQESPFTSLRRKVTVILEKIHVINDGDPGGDGTAQFRAHLYECKENSAYGGAGTGLVEVSPSFSVGGDNYTIESGHDYAVNFKWEVPLKIVNDANKAMELTTDGMEYDGWFETNEHAGQYSAVFQLVFNQGANERMIDQVLYQEATPAPGDSFHYELYGKFSVEYAA